MRVSIFENVDLFFNVGLSVFLIKNGRFKPKQIWSKNKITALGDNRQGKLRGSNN